MLKASSKRRRTKAELKRAAQEELARENEIRTKFARLTQFERELQQTQEQAAINHDAAVLMGDLVNAGVVKQKDDNSFIVQGPQGELNFDYSQKNE